jgi:hypothetical protein
MNTRKQLNRIHFLGWLALVLALPQLLAAQEQPRPYIGYVYPAGGQRGTNLQVRLGGQDLDGVNRALVTGSGVTAKVVEYYRRLGIEELQLLNEQARVLKRETLSASSRAILMDFDSTNAVSEAPTETPMSGTGKSGTPASLASRKLIDRIEKRTFEHVQTPACPAIAALVVLEITIAPDAEPGERELRLVTHQGISNPLGFHVGQVPERARPAMVTASRQVLGKEAQSLRKRLPSEEEIAIVLPCTVNGQIASGEVNRYRFQAKEGQQLVIATLARQLVPYIADAVPGWFQPVIALHDAAGNEVAYADDYQFRPDPIILCKIPKDGRYTLTIKDSLFRGREDFVYRITLGELPFITSIFPLGGRIGRTVSPRIAGFNLQGTEVSSPPATLPPGIYTVSATKKGATSNRVPFSLDDLPEESERETNNTLSAAQKLPFPVLVNGRISRQDDLDIFEVSGPADSPVVAEVIARRLGSPLDSLVRITDSQGKLLGANDDHEDLTAGLNTHQADSYCVVRFPADGRCFVHISDTARQGGEAYAYRLRLSAPRPDFDLRMAPSSLAMSSKSNSSLTVYAQRRDGFDGPIALRLANPPVGFASETVTIPPTQNMAKITIRTELVATAEPVTLSVIGKAVLGERVLEHEAVPCEDRMQAFLWRHLVPAKDLRAMVFDPAFEAPPRRVPGPRPPNLVVAVPEPPPTTNSAAGTNAPSAAETRPRFTPEQATARLRQLKLLFEEGMLTDEFYWDKVAECEAFATSPKS